MMRDRLADCQVGVIGLGLMGGSIALALHDKCASLAGYDVAPAVIDRATERRVIDRPIDPAVSSDEIDLLILATPVRGILDWIARLSTDLPGSFHVIDLGSTKSKIVDAMSRLPERISPIGGHPMCGKETSGLASIDCALFRDRIFVLTPLDRTLPATSSIAQQLVAAIGARPLVLDAQRHDRLAAAVSHVPYLTSIALIDALTHIGDAMAWTLAASGFRDTTRLAASDVTMMLDVLLSNRPAALKNLARLQRSLKEITQLIERNDRLGLKARLEAGHTRRSNLVR